MAKDSAAGNSKCVSRGVKQAHARGGGCLYAWGMGDERVRDLSGRV